MRTIILVPLLTILVFISGCENKKIDMPKPKCYYPTLPTYHFLDVRKMVEAKEINATHVILPTVQLLDLHTSKEKYKSILKKWNLIHVKVNEEYK